MYRYLGLLCYLGGSCIGLLDSFASKECYDLPLSNVSAWPTRVRLLQNCISRSRRATAVHPPQTKRMSGTTHHGTESITRRYSIIHANLLNFTTAAHIALLRPRRRPRLAIMRQEHGFSSTITSLHLGQTCVMLCPPYHISFLCKVNLFSRC